MRRILRAGAIFSASALLLGAAGCSLSDKQEPLAVVKSITPPPGTFHGVVPNPPPPRPSFQLSDTEGRAFDFEKKTGGKATLLFFGYTKCPDVCPTALQDIHTALKLIDEDSRSKITTIFVTTDPQRDTPPVLRKYLQRFDSTFIGLTGSIAQVNAVQDDLRLPAAEIDNDAQLPNGGGYSVNHASAIVAIDVNDRVQALYPSGVTVEDIAADLPLLVRPS